MALYKPSLECEVLFGDLRSSIENSLAMTVSVNFTEGIRIASTTWIVGTTTTALED
ncbi:hypothetical protein Ptr86124_014267, partial [Pyrenophora tritici-repentis]